jgi:L-alanine-DL-glutamate epimerase-like enolase superfamily enzyme
MSIDIDRIEAFVFRAPIDTPVQTSFGIMRDRPAVFIRITDKDGCAGWGEVWCNFPTVGAEHRARLIDSVFAPLLVGHTIESASSAFFDLTERTAVLAIQSAEPGPIAQCIAAIDIALWDLQARRSKLPLWKMLGGYSPRVRVYASGLNPTDPHLLAAEKLTQGYRAFKLKVGFGLERDTANLRALRQLVGDGLLMIDANQAWDLSTAVSMANAFESFEPDWLEEPLRADRPMAEWRTLASKTSIRLAAGENIASFVGFDAAFAAKAFGVMQPDLAKWGGFTGCLSVARKIIAQGTRFCPHYLGAGVGLLASAHLLAAAGGDGMLEVDANPNPLRELTCGPLAHPTEGIITLTSEPGLGTEPDIGALSEFARRH